MGSITWLERGIRENESEEGLCQSTSLQAHPHVEDVQFDEELTRNLASAVYRKCYLTVISKLNTRQDSAI